MELFQIRPNVVVNLDHFVCIMLTDDDTAKQEEFGYAVATFAGGNSRTANIRLTKEMTEAFLEEVSMWAGSDLYLKH